MAVDTAEAAEAVGTAVDGRRGPVELGRDVADAVPRDTRGRKITVVPPRDADPTCEVPAVPLVPSRGVPAERRPCPAAEWGRE